MNEHIDTLDPAILWRHFRTLCNIPRPSGHEAALVAYLIDWAEARGLAHDRDAFGNLRLRKPATSGHESAAGIVLQGHLDMVAQAASDSDHDFTRDSLDTYLEDGWLKARGTTLGADNGLGVAAALAVLEDDSLVHGPLEALFTLEEETSMGGALNLAENWLEGRYLLNLDSEDRGQVYIGCAGGADINVAHEFATSSLKDAEAELELTIGGLVGGHSGLDIHRGRGNANRLMSRALVALAEFKPRLVSWSGGTLRNALPREATVGVVIYDERVAAARQRLADFEAQIRDELRETDPDVSLSVTRGNAENALSVEDTQRLVAVLDAAPYGVERMSAAVEGVVETSSNLGVVQLREGRFHLCALVRSLRDDAVTMMEQRIRGLFALIGATTVAENAYPGWQPAPDAQLLARFCSLHESVTGRAPEIKVIHAGLECGILGAKYPQLEMISFGPLIRGAHSPSERVEVESVGEFWQVLKGLITELAEPAKAA